MSMPGPDTLVGASGAGRNEGRQPFPGDPSEEAAAASDAAPAPSPLSTFLTRSELVPFILELEKSLLVTREHDYAKAPDRVAVLQATTLLERKTEAATTLDGGARTEAGGFRAEQLPGCCGELAGMRRNMLISDENTTFRHLRGVVGLQAAIIREQQEQLYRKDRELASIRKDRDQVGRRYIPVCLPILTSIYAKVIFNIRCALIGNGVSLCWWRIEVCDNVCLSLCLSCVLCCTSWRLGWSAWRDGWQSTRRETPRTPPQTPNPTSLRQETL